MRNEQRFFFTGLLSKVKDRKDYENVPVEETENFQDSPAGDTRYLSSKDMLTPSSHSRY